MTKSELVLILVLLAATCIIVAFCLSGCAVDPWPDPKGDDWWGTTSTPVPRK